MSNPSRSLPIAGGSRAVSGPRGQAFSYDFAGVVGFHSEMEPAVIYRNAFLSTVNGNTLTTTARFGIELSGIDFLDGMVAQIEMVAGVIPIIVGLHASHSMIVVDRLLQVQVFFDSKKELTRESRGHFTVEIAGAAKMVLALRQQLQTRFGDGRLATVQWWYKQGERSNYASIVMEPTPPVYDAFYPFLGEPVEQFIDRYLAHSASILFLMGVPGTGKTSLVRHMAYTRRLNTTLTYDDELLTKDQLFIDFLTSDEDAVLIIEDADTMLGSRETDNNKMISRFLNVSDGLVKMAGKKIVFTTNLGDFKKVDPALVRPGRCFGAVKFRPLTPIEARAAALVAGLEPPTSDRDMTLADLFNEVVGGPELMQIGF